MLPLFLLALASAPAAEASLLGRSTQYPVVNTTLGLVQGGPSNFRSPLVTVFKGIPFAAAPVGDLRWREPQPATAWSGVFNASEFGPACAQGYSSAGIFSSGKTAVSEDCLTLNIWTPSNTTTTPASKLPVYVWIFGGRFEGGSGDVKTYDGSGLASKGVIVVTINYRLGALGFLAHPELLAESAHNSTGNYGIMDQQAAIRWVKDNIANFGGNPDQITVGGQSAGSASSLDIMYSGLTAGLVQGVIGESGARYAHDPMTGSLATSHRFMADALAKGAEFLTGTLNVSTIAEARNLSMQVMIDYADSNSDTTFDDTVFAVMSDAFMNPPLWRPVVDGYVLPYTYAEALALGPNGHLDVPVMTGNNHDESGASPGTDISAGDFTSQFTTVFGNYSSQFLSLWNPNGTDVANASEQYNTFWREWGRTSTWLWADAWAAGGAVSPTYTYFWNHTPAENPTSGAYHGSELWYVFNNVPYASYDNASWTDQDYTIQLAMSDYWVNFISTGNPNGGNLTKWPARSNATKEVMYLGDTWGAGEVTTNDDKFDLLKTWFNVQSAY